MTVNVPHWAFPVTMNADGHPAVTEQDSLEHVRDQIHAALLTRIGVGTPLRPDWGTIDLAFRQQPLDTDSLIAHLVELVPGAALHIDQLPDLVNEALVKLNVYVSTGG